MTKRNLVLFLLFFATATIAAAQSPEAAVAAAVESLRQAMVKVDRPTLERLTNPELSYGHSSGLVEDQAAFIQALVSGPTRILSLDQTDQTIRIVGKTAIVRHIFSATLSTNGQQSPIKLLVLQVWQKRGKQWKLLARQATRVP